MALPDRLAPPAASLAESELIVVSDLHMSLGSNQSGGVDALEQFRADTAFVEFLEYLGARAAGKPRRLRLVILGDFLDFLHARSAVGARGGLRTDTSEGASLIKLNRIAAGHRAVFEALGRFAAAGNAISIVPGNHDIELVRPSAQRRLRELLETASGPAAGENVSFHPWIFYVPGVVYAEHGSQYHDINSFRAPLTPYRSGDRDQVELPLGSGLSLYLLEVLESLGTGAEPVEPTLRNAIAGIRAHPSLALRTLPVQAAFLKFSLSFLALRLKPRTEVRSGYRERVLAPYADELGLPLDLIVSIDSLAARSSLAMAARLLKTRASGRASDYLLRAAIAIDELLERAGSGVPYYVFGHAHRPDESALRRESSGPRYLNSGTWSRLIPEDTRRPGSAQTFIEIVRDGDRPSARLLWWNDAAGRPEPVESA